MYRFYQVSAILRDIVNTQNFQITFMKGFLADAGEAEAAATCDNDEADGDDDVPGWAIGVMAVLGVLCLALGVAVVTKNKKNRGGTTAVQGGSK